MVDRQNSEHRMYPVTLQELAPVGKIANGSLAILASPRNKGVGKFARMSRAILATRSSPETLPAAGPVRGWMDSTVPSSRSLSCTEQMHA